MVSECSALGAIPRPPVDKRVREAGAREGKTAEQRKIYRTELSFVAARLDTPHRAA